MSRRRQRAIRYEIETYLQALARLIRGSRALNPTVYALHPQGKPLAQRNRLRRLLREPNSDWQGQPWGVDTRYRDGQTVLEVVDWRVRRIFTSSIPLQWTYTTRAVIQTALDE